MFKLRRSMVICENITVDPPVIMNMTVEMLNTYTTTIGDASFSPTPSSSCSSHYFLI